MERLCRGCSTPIPYRVTEHNPRQWCTEACRIGTNRRAGRTGYQDPHAPRSTIHITNCVDCGTLFVGRSWRATTCKACALIRKSERAVIANANRRARRRQAFVQAVNPLAIYERDKWMCHICRKKIDRDTVHPHPMSASIDHLIPLARNGTHEPANVAAAHLGCNCSKQASGGGEQLLLIG